MKNKNASASYLTCLAAIFGLVALILYFFVMYKYTPVYIMLVGAIALAALGFVIAKKVPKIANYIPVCVAVLLASAAVWGSQLMINQIGYVIAGLDGIGTILTWIWFIGFASVGMIVAIFASFLPMAKKA